jgi:hypothetical protein
LIADDVQGESPTHAKLSMMVAMDLRARFASATETAPSPRVAMSIRKMAPGAASTKYVSIFCTPSDHFEPIRATDEEHNRLQPTVIKTSYM